MRTIRDQRFINHSGKHYKFYELALTETVTAATAEFIVEKAWGRDLPDAPVTRRIDRFTSRWSAEDEFDKTVSNRLSHGYTYDSERPSHLLADVTTAPAPAPAPVVVVNDPTGSRFANLEF